MASISELRIKFDGMTTTQKKQFILNLKKQLEDSSNSTHKQFLKECISKYNKEIQAAQSPQSPQSRSNTQNLTADDSARTQATATPLRNSTTGESSNVTTSNTVYGKTHLHKKWITVCIITVLVIGAGVVTFALVGILPLNKRDTETNSLSSVDSVQSYSLDLEETNRTFETADNIIQLGGIDWLILDIIDGQALVISKEVLFYQNYNYSRDPFMDVTWETCSLRNTLNGRFYNDTFSDTEKLRILEKTIVNADNPWFPPSWTSSRGGGGNDTTDRVFLLSLDEVYYYFGESEQLENEPYEYEEWGDEGSNQSSDYYLHDNEGILDECSECRIAYDLDGDAAKWWLRSPGNSCETAACVSEDGTVLVSGIYIGEVNFISNAVDHKYCGVRPAMYVNIE